MSYVQTVLADMPLAYYRLNESSGAAANDSSGNGYTGTISGSVTLGAPGLVANLSDTAMRFSGGSILLPTALSTAMGSATAYAIECWTILPVNAPNFGALISFRNDSTADFYVLQMPGGGATGFLETRFMNSSRAQYSTSSAPVSEGAVVHLVMTYDGATLTVYQDAQVIFSIAASGVMSNPPPQGHVATDANNNWFGGTLGEVAIYAHALSLLRVQAHYLAGAPLAAPSGVSVALAGAAPSGVSVTEG